MSYGTHAYGSASYGGRATSSTFLLTLTIGGVNFLPQYVTGSARITEALERAGVMTLSIVANPPQTIPQEGAEVIFKDGSRYLFGGYVSKVEPEEVGKGDLFLCRVEVSDYSYIFNNKIASRAYENQTLKAIVEDLLASYVDTSYGFDTTNVATGPTIDSITFDHISVHACLDKLKKLTGYVWHVDYDKHVYVQAPTATAAPEAITDSSTNHEWLMIAYDTSQVANAVTVIGNENGEESANPNTETFVGNGATRAWALDAKPSTVVSITINGVSKQFSLDVNERSTDIFVYSFSGASFRLTASRRQQVQIR
jgi:hypothetical protein